jgi:dienelactone hydrolase
MFEIFPGNYAWSQAALRAMFTGVSPGDALAAAERLAGARAGTSEAWHSAWASVGEASAKRAAAQGSAGHRLSARASFLGAAICVQWAVAFLAPSDPRRLAGHRRSVELFGAHADLADPPILYREIPYLGGSYPAWLVRPVAPEPAPCAIYLPGWDSTKEQGIGLAAALAARGIAALLCDGPGTGEAVLFRGLVNRPDAEVPGSAAFDALLAEPGIDPARIAVVGSSLGGYRAARFAAFEPRLAAAVIWGASWDFGRTWRKQMADPGSALPTSVEHALHVMGAASAEEVTALLDRWTLDGVAGRIACPLLILHGADDSQIPVSDAEQLYAVAPSTDKTLRIFTAEEGGNAHCQNDNRVRAHDEISDWLTDRLYRH